MGGWSVVMIIGAIIARHCKQWDPFWFYVHTSIQTLGFLAGVVGIILGFALSKKVSSNVYHHKNIGLLILVLGFLQVPLSLLLASTHFALLLSQKNVVTNFIRKLKYNFQIVFGHTSNDLILIDLVSYIGDGVCIATRKGIKNTKILELLPSQCGEDFGHICIHKHFHWTPLGRGRIKVVCWLWNHCGHLGHCCNRFGDRNANQI